MLLKIFCDFDGTITDIDVIDFLIDFIYKNNISNDLNTKLKNNIITYNDYLLIIINIFNTLGQSKKILKSDILKKLFDIIDDNIHIDNEFYSFYSCMIKNNIDFYIISAGFKDIILHMLPYFNINNIYSYSFINNNNLLNIDLNNQYINKNVIINSVNNNNSLKIFIGDGLSDISVINNVDILFVKQGTYLEEYCINNNITFIPFNSFKFISNYICTNFINI